MVQGLFRPETGYETSPVRKEDTPRTEFQIITSVYKDESLWPVLWFEKFRYGNSVRINLPLNWCNDRWTGFVLRTKFKLVYSSKFVVRARVIAYGGESGDTPRRHGHYASEMSVEESQEPYFFKQELNWVLFLSRDYWFATVGNGGFSRIKFIFETSDPQIQMAEQTCEVSLLYEKIKSEFDQVVDISDGNDQLQRPPFFFLRKLQRLSCY